jgi:hypothetical protein
MSGKPVCSWCKNKLDELCRYDAKKRLAFHTNHMCDRIYSIRVERINTLLYETKLVAELEATLDEEDED